MHRNLARAALHLVPEAPPEGRGRTDRLPPENGVGHKEARPAGGNGELEDEVGDGFEQEVQLLAHAEGCGHAHGAVEFAVLHLGVHAQWRGHMGINRTPQELKGETVQWFELDLARGLVGGLVDAGVEHDVVELQLAGDHGGGGMTAPPLQQEGFHIIQLEHAGGGT